MNLEHLFKQALSLDDVQKRFAQLIPPQFTQRELELHSAVAEAVKQFESLNFLKDSIILSDLNISDSPVFKAINSWRKS